MEKAVTRRKWTAGLLIAGTVVLVVAFWSLIMSMLSLLAVAGVLTLLSLPLCKVLEKRLSSGAAAAIALLTLLGAVLGMLWGLIPPLLRQSAQLMSRLPALLDSLRELLARWSAALEARGIPLGDMQAELFSRISAAAGQLAATLVSGIRRLTGSVSQWLLAPLLSFYFLRDRKRLCLLLSLVLPVKYRARGIRAAREMRRESALYLRGQLILSLFVAAMTALALLLTRTPGALLLGLFMGVMELIPYIGPFIAGVPGGAAGAAKRLDSSAVDAAGNLPCAAGGSEPALPASALRRDAAASIGGTACDCLRRHGGRRGRNDGGAAAGCVRARRS